MPLKTKGRWSIGIDPGWKNLGLAIVKEDEEGIHLVHSQTLNPAALGGVIETVDEILRILGSYIHPSDLGKVGIERYVSYSNVNTAEAENILLLIGALIYGFATFYADASLGMYRAIDWKTSLVKLLVKNRGFDNPSSSLDKKFSIAAAHACLDIKGEFSNDHEADAVCLASIGLLTNRYTPEPKAT